ncbi:zinc finger, CCHC-type containing protein [Tanacetum coccineum]|uniref:Zinc finger, CCHC-type containing protein n=1 Tax=Tanacetum coccineum TaxID=301880 RepID=A0ABQ4XTY3_9ASTR
MFRNPFSSTTTGDENPIRTLEDYSKPSHEGYKNTIELPIGNNVVPLRSDTIRLVQNGCPFYGLRFEDPNQHLKDFLKLVDSLDLDGENRERTRLRLLQFSLRDQASNWLERLPAGSITTLEDLTTRFLAQFFPPGRIAKLHSDILMFQQHHGESLSEAWTRRTIDQSASVNKIIPHVRSVKWSPRTLNIAWKDPQQAFVEIKHPRGTDEAGVLNFNSFFESLGLVPPSSNTELICTKEEDGDVMFIEIVLKYDNSRKEEPEAGEQEVEYFNIFPTRSELAYHKYLMCDPIPSIFLRNLIIMEGCPSNLKIPCNIRHVHVEKAYIDLNSPLNIINRMMYNWIMRRKLDPRENAN